jgi:3-dehydroquinate dehydratase II
MRKRKRVIYLISGPNLNMLGDRDPEHYGSLTLSELERQVSKTCLSAGFELNPMQSNYEGDLITWVQKAAKEAVGIILNPGGYTHTSISLHDAVEIARDKNVLTAEVHLSYIHDREPWRAQSFVEKVCIGQFCGKHIESYFEGLTALVERLHDQSQIPKNKCYPLAAVQCNGCGGHGCKICKEKGWLPARDKNGRRCAGSKVGRCNNPIPPGQRAVYCSSECAMADAH